MLRSVLPLIFCTLLMPALWAADTLPQRPQGRVTDQAGMLDSESRLGLERVLADLERKTGAQVAVVTVSSLGEEPIENAAVTLFQRFGIGEKGKDNGILFLIAPKERSVRIEVGYGLEGVITDALSSQIINERVLPYFRQEDMKGGVLSGTLIIADLIARDAQVSLDAPSRAIERGTRPPHKRTMSLFDFIVLLITIIILVPIIIRHPWLLIFLLSRGGFRGGGGGGFGGGFGGFGGGMSGGGGASGRW